MFRILFVIFIFSFNSSLLFSQENCDRVLLQGKVIDTLSPQYFYNFMIVNRTLGKGVFGQPNGSFSLYVHNNDSINISIKSYPIIAFRVVADQNCQFNVKQFIERIPTEIDVVVIHPLKSLQQIKEEREALAMRETRMVTGMASLSSPITALYQAFSKKEQNKAWIAEQEFKDDQRKVVKELLRLYVAYDIIELTEDQFDEFISFLNIDIDFFKTATEMELVTFIKDKYEHFRLLHQLEVNENIAWRNLISKDKKMAITSLLDMYVSNHAFVLPKMEYDRFIQFLGFDVVYLNNTTDLEIFYKVQEKYKNYIEFYKIDVNLAKNNYNISESDNEDWRWDLKHKNKKKAILTLIRLYNDHKVIQVDEKEFDRFIRFVNLKQSFLETAKSEDIINYVRDKYFKYIDFYKD
ncbi:MAG: hypothetical protein HYR91_06360 [Flavobacteriia bacterium]|nr:hypothetical protein [Flavobacteriia bacterium]